MLLVNFLKSCRARVVFADNITLCFKMQQLTRVTHLCVYYVTPSGYPGCVQGRFLVLLSGAYHPETASAQCPKNKWVSPDTPLSHG